MLHNNNCLNIFVYEQSLRRGMQEVINFAAGYVMCTKERNFKGKIINKYNSCFVYETINFQVNPAPGALKYCHT